MSTTIGFADSAPTPAGTHLDNVSVERLPIRVALRVSEVELCWEPVTNKAYRVQYRSEFTTSAWTDLAGPLPGDGEAICFRDSVPSGQPQRFYRVQVGHESVTGPAPPPGLTRWHAPAWADSSY